MNTFNGSEGEWISAQQAHEIQNKYLKQNSDVSEDKLIRCEFFGQEILSKLLKKEGSMGIRFYHGINKDGEPELVLVAVDKNMKNIVEDNSALKDMPLGNNDFATNGPKCPHIC